MTIFSASLIIPHIIDLNEIFPVAGFINADRKTECSTN